MSLQSEQIFQINLINWFTHTYPQFEEDIHHFANERQCHVQQGRVLKRMGVKRGVSDIFIAVPSSNKSGLWLELKVNQNKPSKEQVEFLERKTQRGYAAFCAWDLEQAISIINNYLQEN